MRKGGRAGVFSASPHNAFHNATTYPEVPPPTMYQMHCSPLPLDFPGSRTISQNKSIFYKLPCFRYFVIAQKKKKTVTQSFHLSPTFPYPPLRAEKNLLTVILITFPLHTLHRVYTAVLCVGIPEHKADGLGLK